MSQPTLKGRVIEAGDLPCLNGEPGIIIQTTLEALRDCPAIVFRDVQIRVLEEEVTP